MKKTSILLAASFMACSAFTPAQADPERAYQGGKAVSGMTTKNADDRGAEERFRDWLTQKGREHGGAQKSSGDQSKPSATTKPSRAAREY
jgi:hypothetical protein